MLMSSRHRQSQEDNGLATDSDQSDSSDVESDKSFRRMVEAIFVAADAWYAQKRQEIKKNETNDALPANRPTINQPPSLWSVCCKAWFALPPDSLAATQPMTSEQALIVDMVEREAMKGYSVLADFLDEVKLRSTAENSGEAANKAKVQISTIHSAKGGEWDIVFNARFNEGFHPVKPFAMKFDYKTGRRVEYKMSELDMQRH